MKKLIIILSLFFMFPGCMEVEKKNGSVEVKTSGNKKVKNNIELQEHGLNVEQAFLMYDDNTLVPESNETNVNKLIKCRLIINGWKKRDGKVYPGASEKILTNTGETVLDEPDLFAAYDSTGVTEEDAQYITLSARITKLDKLYDYFVVKFRVWDKTSNEFAEGSFRFIVK